MARRSLVVPDFRDLLVAGYELIGQLVLRLISANWREGRWIRAAVPIAVLVFIVAWSRIRFASLALLIFPLGVMLVRAVDIARMRKRLRQVARNPACQEPDLPHDLRVRSPTIEALWTVARCWTLVRRGSPASVEPTADSIERSMLDREARGLLDAAQALAAWELGNRTEAVRFAALAVPTRIPEVDRPVGLVLLADAWHDEKRLRTLRGGWKNDAGALGELALLIDLQSMSATQRAETLSGLDSALIAILSEDARAVGDRALADALVPPSRQIGPYR